MFKEVRSVALLRIRSCCAESREIQQLRFVVLPLSGTGELIEAYAILSWLDVNASLISYRANYGSRPPR